jgi:hypothetical protein
VTLSRLDWRWGAAEWGSEGGGRIERKRRMGRRKEEVMGQEKARRDDRVERSSGHFEGSR